MTAKRPKKTAAAPAPAHDDESSTPVAGLPIFYRRPALVDISRHADAGLRPSPLLGFAQATNAIPLNAVEFIEAAKSYPILFRLGEGEAMPLALVGLERSNYFIDRKQHWLAGHYIPAYVRQYPFILYQSEDSDALYLCIDEAASSFQAKASKQAARLYDAEGKPTNAATRAMEFCTGYYHHAQMTRAFCTALVQHKLLAPYQSSVRLANDRAIELGGFAIIDETALNALPDAVFLEFRQKGWLAFIYLALASTTNWKRLLELANAAEAPSERPTRH